MILIFLVALPVFVIQITHMKHAENWAVRLGDSFIATAYSLAEKSIAPHFAGIPPAAMVWSLLVLSFCFIAGGSVLLIRHSTCDIHKFETVWQLSLTGILMLCVVGQVAQHYLLLTPYWMERMGLYFIPLYLLLISETTRFLTDEGRGWPRHIAFTVIAVWIIFFLGAFAKSYNLKNIFYDFDQHARGVLQELQRYAQPGTVKLVLGTSPDRDRCFEFYRQSMGLDWLSPVTRHKPPETCQFFYVSTPEEARALEKSGFSMVREFSPAALMKNLQFNQHQKRSEH